MRRSLLVLLTALAACGGSTSESTPAPSITSPPAETTSTTSAPTTASTSTTTTTGPLFEYPYDFAVVDTVVVPGGWDSAWTAVPAVVVADEGTWYMFYSGDGGRLVTSEMGLARSSDGVSWEKVSTDGSVFKPDNGSVGWIAVLQEDDGSWVAWYNDGFAAGFRDVFRATAPDPTGPWTDEGFAFFAPGDEWNFRITVTGVSKVGTEYWMTYGGYDSSRTTPVIGILKSSDGDEWVSIDAPILGAEEGTWFANGVRPSNVIETERGLEILFIGTDRDWTSGINADVETFKIGRLISEDAGATWTLDNDGLPIADTEEVGSPGMATVYEDGRYYLYLGHELGFSGINLISGTIP